MAETPSALESLLQTAKTLPINQNLLTRRVNHLDRISSVVLFHFGCSSIAIVCRRAQQLPRMREMIAVEVSWQRLYPLICPARN
jgi:hypothetical protein